MTIKMNIREEHYGGDSDNYEKEIHGFKEFLELVENLESRDDILSVSLTKRKPDKEAPNEWTIVVDNRWHFEDLPWD